MSHEVDGSLRKMLILCCVFAAVSGVQFVIYELVIQYRRKLAYQGDEVAARYCFLPCYHPMFRALAGYFFLLTVVMVVMTVSDTSMRQRYSAVQLFFFQSVSVCMIPPLLLLQPAVSLSAFMATARAVLPWALSTNIFIYYFLGVNYTNNTTALWTMDLLLLVWLNGPPAFINFILLTKAYPSRVNWRTSSNRCSLLVMVFVFVNVTEFLVFWNVQDHTNMDDERMNRVYFLITFYLYLPAFVINLYMPQAVYRTLLADTKYWRGVGGRNRGGLERLSSSREDMPAVQDSILNSMFQQMLIRHNNLLVDFAFVNVGDKIGNGASSRVYNGTFKGKKKIAIRVRVDAEITEESIEEFCYELYILEQLAHPNIIEFMGMTLRPPQLAILCELMEKGSLKDRLLRLSNYDKSVAMVEISRGLEYMHDSNIMHRDMKAENIFVDRMGRCKIGDFGEAVTICNPDTGEKELYKKAVGTVAYMAPEMVRKEGYSSEVDVYAFAVTMWEIWTGRDPFDGLSVFDIYKAVDCGQRPVISEMPKFLERLIMQAWAEEIDNRIDTKKLRGTLERDVKQFLVVNEQETKALVVPEEMSSQLRVPLAFSTVGSFFNTFTQIGIHRSHSHAGDDPETGGGTNSGEQTNEDFINPVHRKTSTTLSRMPSVVPPPVTRKTSTQQIRSRLPSKNTPFAIADMERTVSGAGGEAVPGRASEPSDLSGR